MKAKTILFSALMILTLSVSSCNSSVKGKWSESDKENFREDMLSYEGLATMEGKEEWVECVLMKCEAKFESYSEAEDKKEEWASDALDCFSEVSF